MPEEISNEIKKNSNVVTVEYNKKNYTLDLDKDVPFELLKKNYKGHSYIEAPLVRAICRAKGIVQTSSNVYMQELSEGLITVTANVCLNNQVSGSAVDIYMLKGIAKTGFTSGARMLSLASKNALKFMYRFFEGDYFLGEDEEELGDNKIDQFEANVKPDIDEEETIKSFISRINEATTLDDLKHIAGDLKSSLLSDTGKSIIRPLYNSRKNLLTKK